MNRKVYHLVHTSAVDHWHLKLEGVDGCIGSFTTKDRALERGRELGQAGGDVQLIVHREDGSIETEHTYGHDPRRTPG